MAKKCLLIVNRQKAAFNRKHTHLPEEPCISIHSGGEVEYAYAVKLTGEWILKQDYTQSPCSGAHIWLEGLRENLEITHTQPLAGSQVAVSVDRDSKPKELDFF